MMSSVMKTCLLALSALGLASATAKEDVLFTKRHMKRGLDCEGNYNVSFFHINDVHAHLDEFSSSGTDCTSPSKGCYGGYSRVKHVIDTQRPNYNDSLWLNVGDEFQGTLFYSYYRGEKIAETMNQLGFDAMTLGNHEFDGGDEELGAFLQNLTNIPIISANIHSTNEILNKTIKPYHIFWDKGIALIGVTTEDTVSGGAPYIPTLRKYTRPKRTSVYIRYDHVILRSTISNPSEGTTFSNAVEAVQNAIDEIKATTNITRIAAITHIGYDKDQELAKQTSGLQLIMGGHSHTLLGNMTGAEGSYPTIATNKDGDEVFIVTAYRWGEYVGYIDVTYDAAGNIVAYHGAPIHLTNTTKQDEDLQAQIDAWRGPFEEFANEVLGISNVELDQTTCQQKECLLGDFMADAMYSYRRDAGEHVDFAMINAGGIRATIDAGDMTRGEVLTSFPFGNSIVELTISGADLGKVLEGIVSGVSQTNGKEVTSFVQISSSLRIQYDASQPAGRQLVSASINNQTLDEAAEYRYVMLDFIAGGGDNFLEPTSDFVTLDTQDEVLVQYITKTTPVDIALDGRIEAVGGSEAAKRAIGVGGRRWAQRE